MTIKRLLTVSAFSIVLAACGSGSDDPADTSTADAGRTADIGINNDGGGTDPGTTNSGSDNSNGGTNDGNTDVSQLSGNPTLFGFIGIDDSPDQVTASALFARYPTNFDTSQLSPTRDQCEVTQFNALDVTGNPFDFIGEFEFISAGNVVTFTSPGGTYLELSEKAISTPDRELRIYDTDTRLSSPAPTSLVVDIPGAEFPAFSAQAIPVVTRPVVSSPAADESVTPNTQFTWVPGTTANSVINISASAGGLVSSTTTTIVNCVVVDDGSFAFDSATQAAMGSDFVSGISGTGGDLDTDLIADLIGNLDPDLIGDLDPDLFDDLDPDLFDDLDANLFGDLTGDFTGVTIERSATRFAQSGNAVLVLTGTAGN